MNKYFMSGVGVVVFMAGLWGGLYVLYVIGNESWMAIPTLITSMLAMAGGVVIFASAVVSGD